MKAWEIVAYTRDGEILCVGCMIDEVRSADYKGCKDKKHRDSNGVCSDNCSGYGPNPVFASEELAAGTTCGACHDAIDE